MRIRTSLTLMGTALAVSTGLLGWELWNTQQLRQEVNTLQSALTQSAVQSVAPTPALPGNLNPLALNNQGDTAATNSAPASPLPSAPGGSAVVPPNADPFDLFFSGSGDIFADIDQLQQRMQQLMSGTGSSLFDADSLFGTTGIAPAAQPQIDMQESSDAYTLTITLPEGSNMEVNTEVENGQLNIEGKVTVQQQDTQQGRSATRVQTQQFARSLPLPADVDALGIHNEARDNQVIVTLPKSTS